MTTWLCRRNEMLNYKNVKIRYMILLLTSMIFEKDNTAEEDEFYFLPPLKKISTLLWGYRDGSLLQKEDGLVRSIHVLASYWRSYITQVISMHSIGLNRKVIQNNFSVTSYFSNLNVMLCMLLEHWHSKADN